MIPVASGYFSKHKTHKHALFDILLFLLDFMIPKFLVLG
jgi:hypothetical protein